MASEDEIATFLNETPAQPYTEMRRLSGGYTNHTWLVTVPCVSWAEDASSRAPTSRSGSAQPITTMVVKHARAYTTSSINLYLPASRQEVEHSALVQVAAFAPDDGGVFVPRVLRYDAERHLIAMTNGGSRTLKEAYASLDADTLGGIARRLYAWITGLHRRSVGRVLDVDAKFEGHKWAQEIYGCSYRGFGSVLEKYGMDDETNLSLARRVNEIYGAMLTADVEQPVLCHGDFWPGNIVLPGPDTNAPGEVEGKGLLEPPLTVVDWEITRRDASGVTDIAQFAAEAFLLDFFRGGKGLTAAFLGELVDELGEKGDDGVVSEIRRLLAHWGVHVVFWPSMMTGWSDDDPGKLKQVAELALDGIRRAVDGNTEEVWEGLHKIYRLE